MLLVAHTGRAAAIRVARVLVAKLSAAGMSVRVLEPEAVELDCAAAEVVPVSPRAAIGAEMVLVVGGDGTLLRAAELARPAGVPLLGVNLGHVGFLAEAEPEDLSATVTSLAAGQYSVEERMTIEVSVRSNGDQLAATWALNEATVEKSAQGAHAGPRRRGRRQATVALWLRRRGVRDADRLDGLRVLGGRPSGLAGGRGVADGADLSARAVRRAHGRFAEVSTRS